MERTINDHNRQVALDAAISLAKAGVIIADADAITKMAKSFEAYLTNG